MLVLTRKLEGWLGVGVAGRTDLGAFHGTGLVEFAETGGEDEEEEEGRVVCRYCGLGVVCGAVVCGCGEAIGKKFFICCFEETVVDGNDEGGRYFEASARGRGGAGATAWAKNEDCVGKSCFFSGLTFPKQKNHKKKLKGKKKKKEKNEEREPGSGLLVGLKSS